MDGRHGGGRRRQFTTDLNNLNLVDVLMRFDANGFSGRDSRAYKFRPLWPLFEESLSMLAPSIVSEESFNADTFLTQASWLRREMASCTEERRDALHLLCSVLPLFYRYVQDAVGHSPFAEGAAMTPYLLSSSMLSRFLCRGALFTVWTPFVEYVPGRDFYVVTIHGMDDVSTRIKAVDYVTVDLEPVPERYKALMFRYVLSTPKTISSLHGCSLVKMLVPIVNEYMAVKEEPGYPDPDPREMTRAEMDHMRNFIIGSYANPETGNAYLRAFRDAARWAIDNGVLRGDRHYLRRLPYAREKGKGRQEDIPVRHLNMLVGRLRELSSKDSLHACCYVAIRVLVLTKMRISALCSLRRDCFVQTPDHGVWQVVTNSKTSGAGKEPFTVTDSEMEAARALSKVTDPLRPRMAGRAEQDYLFLYEGRSGIRALCNNTLGRVMREACDDLDLPHYYARHVRSFRQTRAARFAEKVGLSKHDTEILTGHRNRETTMNNYVAVSAADYYAALYGVMTEDVQKGVRGTVVEEMPQGVVPAAGDGATLGACSCTDICTARTLLPCLTCRSFVTDVHHLRLFEQAVEDIDRRIMETTVEHDKEDLVNVKEIYVVFIQKIKELLCKKEKAS